MRRRVKMRSCCWNATVIHRSLPMERSRMVASYFFLKEHPFSGDQEDKLWWRYLPLRPSWWRWLMECQQEKQSSFWWKKSSRRSSVSSGRTVSPPYPFLTTEGGNWRTRHLKMRSSYAKQAVMRGDWQVGHKAGEVMIADIGTKGQREFESPTDFAFVKESLGVCQKRNSVWWEHALDGSLSGGSFFSPALPSAHGHGRSTLEICESKKGETGITCRSLFTGWEEEQPKTETKNNTTKHQTEQKGAGENPRKSGETCAPPKASHFISSTL